MSNTYPLENDDQEEILDEASLQRAIVTRFPTPINSRANHLSREEKISLIEGKFQDILEILGLDLEDESLQRTPYRVAKMYVDEVFSGLDSTTFPRISFFEDRFTHQRRANMVFVKVSFNSFCEHHLVPMEGTAYVAYIPNGRLIGLSKIPRIVRFFARRPQIQERLTAQIADSLASLLNTESVAVSLSAQHHCMVARGVENESSHAITNVLRGDFDTEMVVRKEFFDAINR